MKLEANGLKQKKKIMKIKEIFDSMAYGPAPESAGEANAFLDAHNRRFGLFIGGQWREPSSDAYFESTNPANRQLLAHLAEAGQQDVNAAVELSLIHI